MPGITTAHQLFVSSACCASESMLPHEMTSSGRPRPRKLSVDSARIALCTFMTTMKRIAERKFGARCSHRTWKNPPPMHRAASTYSLVRRRRTSVRTTLAIPAQPVTPMTRDKLQTEAVPRMACKSTISSRCGTLRKISIPRIRSASSRGPAQPLSVPSRAAMTVEMAAPRKPIVSDARPPYQIIEKMSRPIASVPKRNSWHGATLQLARSI